MKIESKHAVSEEEKKALEERERVKKVLEELRKELPLTIKQFGEEFEKRTGCELAYHEFSVASAHLNAMRIKASGTEIVIGRDEEAWVAYCNYATVPIRLRPVLMKTPFKEVILWYDYDIP
ncbi:MAG: hypothetical protein JHC33_15375 [Ignisphaera sp.]|nr:hypothetical protein [Ignisphaera sp.]